MSKCKTCRTIQASGLRNKNLREELLDGPIMIRHYNRLEMAILRLPKLKNISVDEICKRLFEFVKNLENDDNAKTKQDDRNV